MLDRIKFSFAGDVPQFRVSRPDKDAGSTNEVDLILTETSLTLRPNFAGSVNFTGTGTRDIALSGYTQTPIILLKCSDNTNFSLRNYYGRLINSYATLRIFNRRSGTRTIYYWVFKNVL